LSAAFETGSHLLERQSKGRRIRGESISGHRSSARQKKQQPLFGELSQAWISGGKYRFRNSKLEISGEFASDFKADTADEVGRR
jgi:hypothetical protein